jgi:hypothetical protein
MYYATAHHICILHIISNNGNYLSDGFGTMHNMVEIIEERNVE